MQAVILQAATSERGLSQQLADQFATQLSANHWQVKQFHLATLDLRPNPRGLSGATTTIWRALQESDLWVVVTPTYLGSYAGQLKVLMENLRTHLFSGHAGGRLSAGTQRGKQYVLVTDCYASAAKNFWWRVTNPPLAALDNYFKTAGLKKAGEIVVANTWQHPRLDAAKRQEITALCQRLDATRDVHSEKKELVMRYLLLLITVAVTSLLAEAGTQQVLVSLHKTGAFWWHWGVFVALFYAILAVSLHLLVVFEHKFK